MRRMATPLGEGSKDNNGLEDADTKESRPGWSCRDGQDLLNPV